MAMTGGTKKLVKSGTKCDLYVYYKTSQDVANNMSTVTCGMYIVVPDNYPIGPWTDYNGSYVGRLSSTFDGSIDNVDGTIWLVENESFTVDHKADGTASTTIYWKWGVNSSWGGMVNPSGSFTITLPTIPRKSSVSATNAYIGNESTITISSKNGSFTHTLQYKISGQDSYTTIISKTSNTSYKWTIPSKAYKYLSSTGKTVKITINCITYSGSSKIGSSTYTITATGKNSDLKPSKPTLTGSIVKDFDDLYIKGKSSIKLTSTAPTTKYGAEVKSYIFTGPNISGSSATYTGTSSTKTSSAIQSTGKLSYSVQVKDSRGVLSDKSEPVSITVSDYSMPTIQLMPPEQSENDSGMKITVTVVTTHRKVGSNAITVTMSDIDTISPTVTKSSSTTKNITTTTFTYTYSGVPLTSTGSVTATANDSVYPSRKISKSVSITSASRILNIAKYGNGVAIGGLSSVEKSTETSKFECNWDMYMNKTFRFPQAWDDKKNYPRITCQWRDGLSHEMITRSDDGLTMGIGWTGKHTNEDETTTQYDTRLSLRPPITTATGRLCTNSKTEAFDGKQGVAIYPNGRLYLVGDASQSIATAGIVFAYNKSTSATSSILETASGKIKINAQVYIPNAKGLNSYTANEAETNLIYLNSSNNLWIGDSNVNNYYINNLYNKKTTSSPNLVIGETDKILRHSSSSKRYKRDIQNIQSKNIEPNKLYDLPVREFKYNEGYLSDDDRNIDTVVPGFIAEEVEEYYPIACEYVDDKPENWNFRFIIPGMLKLIQDQKKEIDNLKEEVNDMKLEIENLKESIKNEA